jgi:hypothetical protein
VVALVVVLLLARVSFAFQLHDDHTVTEGLGADERAWRDWRDWRDCIYEYPSKSPLPPSRLCVSGEVHMLRGE